MTEDWHANLDNRKSVAVVAVDLSKELDSVCHNLLIAKLKAYGFSIEALNLMKNYLLNRRQRVTITGIYSNWRTITTGLPQGKFLAPFLSNLFMNDLNYFVSNISLRLYADDTTEYFADHSPMALEHIINNELNTLTEWFDWNILVTNPSKTQALTLRPTTCNYDLKINDLPIEIKDSLKILEINMDGKLTFKEHVKDQLMNAYAKCSALRRIKRMMTRLYKSYVLPHLDYCSPVLIGIGKTQTRKLEEANYYTLRTLLRLARSNSYENVLHYAQLKSLTRRRHFQSLILLFKCLKSQGPIYLKDFFKVRLAP